MNKHRLVCLIDRLKQLTYELECEVKEDKDSYLKDETLYDEILKYVDTNDDDGDAL